MDTSPQPGERPGDAGEAPGTSPPDGTAPVPSTPGGSTTGECVRLCGELLAGQTEAAAQLSAALGQLMFLRQMLIQLGTDTGARLDRVVEAEAGLRAELDKYRTGGPQRAMASVFHRLFRDLVAHVTALDDLVAMIKHTGAGEDAAAWARVVRITRDRFETVLGEWGCTPMPIGLGEEAFDPEIHEGVAATVDDRTVPGPAGAIVGVRRRGWRLHDAILQYPQVIVANDQTQGR